MTQFRVGDRVTPVVDDLVPSGTRGRVFVVRKVNPRNLRCDAEDGGRGINFPASLLLPATDENVAAGRAGLATTVPVGESFSEGEVVTLARPFRDWGADLPMVVVGGRNGKVNVVPIGGAGGRYLRIGPGGLVRRDTAWLGAALRDGAGRGDE